MVIKKPSYSGIETKRDEADFRAGVVGSNPAAPARAKIFGTLWELKKRGYSGITLKVKGERNAYMASVTLTPPSAAHTFAILDFASISSDQRGP